MKYLFVLFLIPQLSLADIITECGEYTANGVVRAKQEGIQLIVNEKTQSEYVVTMSTSEQGQLGGYIDRDVTIELVLDKKFNGQSGSTSKIISSKSRIPNPLYPGDTGFKLDKKVPCKID